LKLFYLFALLCMGLVASACNTTRGVGQDVEATGEAIEETAEDAMDDDRDYRP
jgi:predicted small secreted protein